MAFIIFAECGLFAILPGDSLLFTVGLFVALGAIDYPLWFVCLVLTVAAVLGNACGYMLGRIIGPPLFRERRGVMGKIFKQSYVTKTHAFFEKYGNRALILARFVPIVRTFVTLVAGVGKMDFRTLHHLHRHRRHPVGLWSHHPRLLPRAGALHPRQHRGRPGPDRAGLGDPDGGRVRAAPPAAEARCR